MKHPNTRFHTTCALLASLVFLLLGSMMIPFAGVQEDEALFAVPIFLFKQRELSIRLLHRQIPLMVMSYIGTLKTLLYAVIFHFWHVTVWSVRLPMVLVGAVTVFVLFKFTSRAVSPFAGVAAACLLATDPIFIVTNTFDWGPNALGHLLLVTACFFLVRFGQQSLKMRDLAQGFFFLGLALWNKALFFWCLGGLGVGAVVFWPEIRKNLRLRTLSVATAGFLIGSLPFLIFNFKNRNATIGENAHLEPASISQILDVKLRMVAMSMDGSGLLGFIPETDVAPGWHPPLTRRGQVAEWIRQHLGRHSSSGFDIVFVLALLAVPLWWRRRAAWFALIFMTVTWIAMAFTKGAGGAVHHSVLLWPFPEFFVAVVFDSIPWRHVATAGVAVMVLMNLLVVNEYLAEFDRNGGAGNFTDAFFALDKAILDTKNPVYVTDWGMANNLSAFHEGRLTLYSALGLFQPETLTDEDQAMLKRIVDDPAATFIDHVPDREVMKGVNQHIDREAARLGKKKQILQVIRDSHGRPVYEIFRFAQD